jgi:hypothetical protein
MVTLLDRLARSHARPVEHARGDGRERGRLLSGALGGQDKPVSGDASRLVLVLIRDLPCHQG